MLSAVLLAASYRTSNAKILQGDTSTAQTLFEAKSTPSSLNFTYFRF